MSKSSGVVNGCSMGFPENPMVFRERRESGGVFPARLPIVDTDAPESTRNVHLCPPTYASTVGCPRPSSFLACSSSGQPYCMANMELPALGRAVGSVF